MHRDTALRANDERGVGDFLQAIKTSGAEFAAVGVSGVFVDRHDGLVWANGAHSSGLVGLIVTGSIEFCLVRCGVNR